VDVMVLFAGVRIRGLGTASVAPAGTECGARRRAV